MIDFTITIVAGGQSSRMGRDKAFVKVGGVPMVERVISRTTGLGQSETVIITNTPDDYAHLNLPTYPDVIADKGALGGIYSAVYHTKTPYALVLACDMPFVNAGVLRLMLDQMNPEAYDVIVPRVENYPQGMHALYSRACLPHIRERLDANRLKVISFYEAVRVCYLDEPDYRQHDPHNTAFMNVNTPEQLANANTLASR